LPLRLLYVAAKPAPDLVERLTATAFLLICIMRQHLVGDGKPGIARNDGSRHWKQFLLFALKAFEQCRAETVDGGAKLRDPGFALNCGATYRTHCRGHGVSRCLAKGIEFLQQAVGGAADAPDCGNQEFIELAPVAILVQALERIAGIFDLTLTEGALVKEIRLQQLLQGL